MSTDGDVVCAGVDHCLPYYLGIPAGCVVLALMFVMSFLCCLCLFYCHKKRRLRRLAATLGDEQPILVVDDEAVDYSRTISLDRPHGRRSTKKNKNKNVSIGMHQFPSVPVESFREHVQELTQAKGFTEEYKWLEDTSPNHPITAAFKRENMNKNRYRNISPFDHTRVVLQTTPTDPHSDYINANYIDGYSHFQEYIAAQGPLDQTIDDFWRMVWEENTHIIVMVTNLYELGRMKCAKYWPDTHSSFQVGELVISTDLQDVFPTFTKRHLTVVHVPSGESRAVLQFHFTRWPDFGAPSHPYDMLHFVRLVRACMRDDHGPLVAHCSAGVGRSGTFIAIDILLQHIKDHAHINIRDVLYRLRDQRMKMVQSVDQYEFIYKAILEACQFRDTLVEGAKLGVYLPWLKGEGSKETELANQMELLRVAGIRSGGGETSEYSLALSEANIAKNRDLSRLPLDHNRVRLGDNGDIYINASPIKGYTREVSYLVTQHPKEDTVYEFWLMVLQYRVNTVAMLGPLDDQRAQDLYWQTDRPLFIKGITVTMETKVQSSDFRRLDFTVSAPMNGYDPVGVSLYHFYTWPISTELVAMAPQWVSFIGEVERGSQPPVVLHTTPSVSSDDPCGVFCALSILLTQLRREEWVDVFQTVRELQRQRPSLITTKEHYYFIYRCLLEWLKDDD